MAYLTQEQINKVRHVLFYPAGFSQSDFLVLQKWVGDFRRCNFELP